MKARVIYQRNPNAPEQQSYWFRSINEAVSYIRIFPDALRIETRWFTIPRKLIWGKLK